MNPQSERPARAADVVDVIGPQEDFILARIVATGATPAEVAAAYTWLNADDVMGQDGGRPNSGRVAQVFAILQEQLSSPDDI
jgi:hypothetical protein